VLFKLYIIVNIIVAILEIVIGAPGISKGTYNGDPSRTPVLEGGLLGTWQT
jgi:hypothetical protein